MPEVISGRKIEGILWETSKGFCVENSERIPGLILIKRVIEFLKSHERNFCKKKLLIIPDGFIGQAEFMNEYVEKFLKKYLKGSLVTFL